MASVVDASNNNVYIDDNRKLDVLFGLFHIVNCTTKRSEITADDDNDDERRRSSMISMSRMTEFISGNFQMISCTLIVKGGISFSLFFFVYFQKKIVSYLSKITITVRINICNGVKAKEK